MEKKKLFIIVGVLLLSVGVSFSYFVSQVFMNGIGSKTTITTANINGANLKVEGTLNFSDENIYPGHSSISGIKVTATGNNELVPYNLIWTGTNTISQLNYKVYKTSSEVDIKTECEKKMKVMDGAQVLSEFCEFTNLDKLGEPVETGTINKEDTKVTLVKDEFITATSDGQSVYYYVILEFPNLESIQNVDLGGSFTGKVIVEESDKKPDITILAFKVEQDDGSYKEQTDIPVNNGYIQYVFSSEKSTCSNGATPTWNSETKQLITSNLTKSGTSCYLAFDIASSTMTLKKLNITNINNGTPTFSNAATTDEGIYSTEDEMYGGTSYYWRGASTTNHVIFADKCWRIVRINGDGSIRLIYNGAIQSGNKCPGNGANSDSIVMGATFSEKYYATSDGKYDNNSYVGWTYTLNQQRPNNNENATDSNAKVQTEKWYDNNIGNNAIYSNKVANGYFCNDRNVESGSTWSVTGTSFKFAAAKRISDAMPTLSCQKEDTYVLKVGAITADETMYAGGKFENNKLYYLYLGQSYWTMTPYSSSGGGVSPFCINLNGYLDLGWDNTDMSKGLRPVINLKSDTMFNAGSDGTQDNPYIVQ